MSGVYHVWDLGFVIRNVEGLLYLGFLSCLGLVISSFCYVLSLLYLGVIVSTMLCLLCPWVCYFKTHNCAVKIGFEDVNFQCRVIPADPCRSAPATTGPRSALCPGASAVASLSTPACTPGSQRSRTGLTRLSRTTNSKVRLLFL